jgi:predicted nucleic acid-binding protein
MPSPVLLDNTVLSNFALVRQLQLLRQVLGHRAATVAQVIAEYERGVALRRVPATGWEWLTIYSLTNDELNMYQALLRRVNAGEAACLAVAYTRKLSLVTDDRDARQLAVQYGIPKTGTIGILVEAVHRNILTLSQANEILRHMITVGYRCPLDKLDTLI